MSKKTLSGVEKSIINALAKEYDSLFYVDLDTGEVEDYKNFYKFGEKLADNKDGLTFDDAVKRIAYKDISDKEQEEFVKTNSIKNIRKELSKKDSFEVMFRPFGGGRIHYASIKYIKVEEKDGKPLSALAAISNNEDQVIGKYFEHMLVNEFEAAYFLDLESNVLRCYRQSPMYDNASFISEKIDETVYGIAKQVSPEYKKAWEKFADVDYLQKCMEKVDRREMVYEVPGHAVSWRRASLQVVSRRDGKAATMIATFSGLDSESIENLNKEKRLNESIRLMFESTPGMAFIKDADSGEYINCNNKFADFAGKKSPAEVLGLTDEDLFEPDTAKHFRLDDKKVNVGDKSYQFYENAVDANRKSRYLQTTKQLYVDPDGRECILGMSLDVTEMIELKRALEEAVNENYIKALAEDYECVNLVQVYSDAKNDLIIEEHRISKRLERMIPGWTREHIFYKSQERFRNEVVHADDRAYFKRQTDRALVFRSFDKGKSHNIDFRAVVDGNVEHFQQRLAPVYDNDGRVSKMIVGIRSVEEEWRKERQIQSELEEAKNKAEQANKAKSNFLFNMSHDIRTPMNAITGYTSMARRYMSNEQKVEDCLSKIEVSGNQLLLLVNQVLDMSRIEAGKIVLREEPVNFNERMRAMVSIFASDAEARGIHFVYPTNEFANPIVLADDTRLSQVVINVLSNAVKYTPKGGTVSYNTYQRPGTKEGFAKYVLRVEDNGIGMSEEFLNHIYEDFSRENNSTVSGIQGTGLGMAIVKKLVDLMGGSIRIKSTQGKGTMVEVSIELRMLDDVAYQRSKRDIDYSIFKNKRILLVEDNEMNREISKDMLMEGGVIVEEAADGDLAVEMVERSKVGYYDLILMDIQMPRMDGYEATNAIRNLDGENSKIPIIALTANAFEEDRKKAFEAGMDAHLAKPVKMEDMFRTMSLIMK